MSRHRRGRLGRVLINAQKKLRFRGQIGHIVLIPSPDIGQPFNDICLSPSPGSLSVLA